MSMLRWLIGVTLVSLFLFLALVPNRLTRAAGAQQAQQGEKKRVYTNDDWPFNEPRASAGESSADTGVGASGADSKGERVAPFVPTPMEIVDKMLEIAEVTSKDVVYDLGSGDGRIVLRAAERFGAKAVGVEIDPGLARESTNKAKDMKLEQLVSIIEGDLFQTDLKPATVITVYLLLSTNDRLRPILEKDLRPGTRVVAHDIRIPGWEPSVDQEVTVGGGIHYVYLYRIPDAFQKRAPR
ncbi:MAG TPA: class I SAM-dependent methyltransferase [Terriglobia bacterium]